MNSLYNFIRLAAGSPKSRGSSRASQGSPSGAARYPSMIAPKAQAINRKDISDWKRARRDAANVDRPRRVRLVDLYDEVMLDAHLTSQIGGRVERTLGASFQLNTATGEYNEEATKILAKSAGFAELLRILLETPYWGHSVVELVPTYSKLTGTTDLSTILIPRQNIVPSKGFMLFDSASDKGLCYRDDPRFGVNVLEFGRPDDLGLLNKAVPHALFKRFSQSCWAELAEIYGIPPRYIKTDTTDPAMVARAEAMMRDMGAAAYWVIDTTEEFQFAKAADTNGDVYRNLITLCNNEMSLLVSGAVIGQDTVNGNRSKEEVGIDLLDSKAAADRRMIEDAANSAILPALAALGLVPPGLTFAFSDKEDVGELWKRTVQALQYYEVDTDWVRNKFGIEVIAPRAGVAAPGSAQGESLSFFGERE